MSKEGSRERGRRVVVGVKNEFVYARYKMQMRAWQYASAALWCTGVFVLILYRQAMMLMTVDRPMLRASNVMGAVWMTGQVFICPVFS